MMKLKTFIGLAFAGLMFASSAHAYILSAGDVKFTFDTYSKGHAGYNSPANGTLCSTVAECDAVDTDLTNDGYGGDVWGIFSIAAIQNTSTGVTTWVRGQDGQYLTGIYGGLQDAKIEKAFAGSANEFQISNMTGGWMEMYWNTADYDPTLTPAGRTAEKEFTGINSADLALSAIFDGATNGGDPYPYVASTFIKSVQGSGSGYMDVIGGDMADWLDTNAMIDTAGTGRDLFFGIKYDDANFNASENGWTVLGTGDVKGQVETPTVAEPGTLALMGLGLLGLGAAVRRKIK